MTKTILAIETSCDETSVAVLESTADNGTVSFRTLSHITLTQATMHAEYGGVYPNMARREHQLNITSIIAEALQKAGVLGVRKDTADNIQSLNYLNREELVLAPLTDFATHHDKPAIDVIAVTTGPGLEPALWVGVNTARALADYWQIPLIPVNHMEGHILSVLARGESFEIPSIPLPALALLISGGHTELVQIDSIGTYTKIGQTRDDAIGEAFDKVARLMGLPYPGGPHISRLAAEHEQQISGSSLWLEGGQEGVAMYSKAPRLTTSPQPPSSQKGELLAGNPEIKLPRPMMHSGDLDFSFSGIKTAVRYLVESLPKPLSEETKQVIAHEFETAVTEVIVHKTKKAITEYGLQSLIVAGGVAANTRIRTELTKLCKKLDIQIFLPEGVLAMDNALMIAIAGALKLNDPEFTPPNLDNVVANGNWSL